MSNLSSKLLIVSTFACVSTLVAGCAVSAESDTSDGVSPPEQTGSDEEALGPPSSCSYKEAYKYKSFLIGCHNGVGTWEVFRCWPVGGSKFEWFGQPQAGFWKGSCAN